MNKELKYCLSKTNPYPHLAARFAGKEAVIKLISGFGGKISPNEIEILNDNSGAPGGVTNRDSCNVFTEFATYAYR